MNDDLFAKPVSPAEKDDNAVGSSEAIGHNNPPVPLPYDEAVLNDLTAKTDAFVKASEVWRDPKTLVEDDTQAELLTSQINNLRKMQKAIEDGREKQKSPHIVAGKKVDEVFKAQTGRLDIAIGLLKAKIDVYLREKQRQAAELQAQRDRDARAAAEKARLAAAEAEAANNIDAIAAADQAQKEAVAAQIEADRKIDTSVKPAHGGSRALHYRKRKEVVVDKPNALYMHYREKPQFASILAELVRLATAEANAAGFSGDIPGCTINTVETLI